MMEIFISQPMRGKTTEQILQERDELITKLSRHFDCFHILDTVFDDFNTSRSKNIPLAYLAKSIEYLAQADLAVFMEGWEDARGCKIEKLCAEQYGIKTMEEREL